MMLPYHTGDGDKKARSPGRARSTPLKPLARGNAGCFGGPVATTLVCFIPCTRGYGCCRHPAFPAPFLGSRRALRAEDSFPSTRAHHAARAWNHGCNYRHCLRQTRSIYARERSDEAIHCSLVARWIASRSLSSGAHSRDPLARNDVLLFEISVLDSRIRHSGRRVRTPLPYSAASTALAISAVPLLPPNSIGLMPPA
jgi:hypothetical protein